MNNNMDDEAIKSVEDEILRAEQEEAWDVLDDYLDEEPPKQYRFDRAGHMHLLDGKPLHGVTTVLSVISKPALIQWAANMAVDHIESILNKKGSFIDTADWISILKEARIAHRTKKEKAGDWGTLMHEAIEHWIKQEPGATPLGEDQQALLEKFKAWVAKNNVSFLASEKHVWSEELWIGGICDVILKIGDKTYIGDFKTSSGIYDEAFFQIAAYHLAMIEMGLYTNDEIEGYIVINLKKDGTLDFKIATDKELNQQAFKHALGLYKIINSLK